MTQSSLSQNGMINTQTIFQRNQSQINKVQNVTANSYFKHSQQSGHWGKISEWLDNEAVKMSSGKKKKLKGDIDNLLQTFLYIFCRDLKISEWVPDREKTNEKHRLLLHEWRGTHLGRTAKHKKKHFKMWNDFIMSQNKRNKG